jgi:hypothetical protein
MNIERKCCKLWVGLVESIRVEYIISSEKP